MIVGLEQRIKQTRNELTAAESRFNNATNGEDIEKAILKMWELEFELDRLYGLAKEVVAWIGQKRT